MIRNGTTLPGRSPAHQEVVGALDQACAIWGLAGGERRSRFIEHCLRYGLLSLLDAGVLEFPEAADPEFVRHYREIEARLSAAGASAILTSPGFCSSAWATGCSGADAAASTAPWTGITGLLRRRCEHGRGLSAQRSVSGRGRGCAACHTRSRR